MAFTMHIILQSALFPSLAMSLRFMQCGAIISAFETAAWCVIHSSAEY